MNKFTETNQGRYVVNPTTWQLTIQLDYVFFFLSNLYDVGTGE